MEYKDKKIKLVVIVCAFLVLVAAYLVIGGVLIYAFGFSKQTFVGKTAGIFPYPAAFCGKNMVTFEKLEMETSAARQFYESQDFSDMGFRVDFSTADGQKRLEVKRKNVLNKLVENCLVQTEAEKRGVKLTKADIDQEVDRKLKEYGTEDSLKKNLERLYGWTLEDFKENIVKPDIYKERLFEDIKKTDPSYAEARKKMEGIKNQLDNKADFRTIAEKYSDGESARNGGELGWFSASQMLPEVAAGVMDLEKNSVSEIIESSIGYHIVKVEDKKNENGTDMLKLSQIFIRTTPLSDQIIEIEKNRNVYIPFKEFKWNKDTGSVEFADQKMRDFESNLSKNSPNDLSIMF